MVIKVAYGSVPKDSGTFTFYRNLLPEIKQWGIDLRCVTVGCREAALWEDSYADNNCVLLAPKVSSVEKQSMAFCNWCIQEGIDIVIGVNSEAILSSLPHLPSKIRVMARCANAFDHGYRITLAGRERLSKIIALSPRLRDDLIKDYSVSPELIQLIPNGINPKPFESAAAQHRGTGSLLRLGFLGRLEHNQKGVLHLPAIAKALQGRNIPFELHIAGKGRHGARLRQLLGREKQDGKVHFHGALSPEQVPDFLSAIDLFLFPSHFEGIPNALLEAMMAGCIPLAWKIAGITDFVIEAGKTGFLFNTGDVESMAKTIGHLHHHRSDLNNLRQTIAQEARIRFNPTLAAKRYAKTIREVMANPPPPFKPLPWTSFKTNENFSRSWTEHLPHSVRLAGKSLLSRLQKLH